MRALLFALLLTGIWSVQAAKTSAPSALEQRIKPVGQVHVDKEEEVTEASDSAPDQTSGKSGMSGEAVYRQYCTVCHQNGLAGAPRFRHQADWKAKADGKTIDELLAIAIKGVNAMPAKGTCLNCSPAELKAAIEYMMPDHD